MNWKPITAAWGIAVVLASAGEGRAQTPLAVKNLRCEYKVDPAGIDVRKPRLSWQLESSERGVVQATYEVRVGRSEEGFNFPSTIVPSSLVTTRCCGFIFSYGTPLGLMTTRPSPREIPLALPKV